MLPNVGGVALSDFLPVMQSLSYPFEETPLPASLTGTWQGT
jgi:hypothetical protein